MLRAIFKTGATVLLATMLMITVFVARDVFAQGPAGPLIPEQPRSSRTHSFEPPDTVGSHALNWAGYIATGHTYTSVSGSWVVPHVADSSENVADATWVGIGGAVSTDLIQAGTEAVPDDNGNLVYQAWYELLPDNSMPVPLAISPGDVISVAVTQQSSGEWLISFTNASTGQRYEKSVHYDSSGSSADWIEEMPVEVGGVMKLDDFGSVHFSAGYAIADGTPVSIADSGAQAVIMDNTDGSPVAIPSKLDAASGFTVARTHADASPLAVSQGDQRAVPVEDIGNAYTARVYNLSDPETLRIILMQF
ncbi:MAG TPA: G1 family glutamic endopeptidase [Candidatus Paceibacterota bacterium]|nr:G1 family glutamic endopeptidase [Candidatus Paceibacterota bacterium]